MMGIERSSHFTYMIPFWSIFITSCPFAIQKSKNSRLGTNRLIGNVCLAWSTLTRVFCRQRVSSLDARSRVLSFMTPSTWKSRAALLYTRLVCLRILKRGNTKWLFAVISCQMSNTVFGLFLNVFSNKRTWIFNLEIHFCKLIIKWILTNFSWFQATAVFSKTWIHMVLVYA